MYENRRLFYQISSYAAQQFARLDTLPDQQPLITKTCLFKHNENFTTQKNEIFQIKKSDIFHISAQNIDSGYSLEPPRLGGSKEY